MSGEGTRSELADQVEAQADLIAARITDEQFAASPQLHARFGERGRRACTSDAKRHLSYLTSALSQGSDALFADYVQWASVLLGRLGLGDADLTENLGFLRAALIDLVPGAAGLEAARVVDAAVARLGTPGEASPRAADAPPHPHAELAREYLQLLLRGDRQGASALILRAVEDGVSVRDVYMHVFQPSQYEIGRLWQVNEISVAQEHFCTAATQLIMSQLYPQIFASTRVQRGLVAACVGGDLHEIGVRMVADFFEMEGWDTWYLGANTPVAGIIHAVDEHRPHAVAISATMAYHVPTVAQVIAALRERTAPAPQILVGGYPFGVDVELWRRVGADGCAADAPGAVALARRLVDGVPNR